MAFYASQIRLTVGPGIPSFVGNIARYSTRNVFYLQKPTICISKTAAPFEVVVMPGGFEFSVLGFIHFIIPPLNLIGKIYQMSNLWGYL